MSNLPPPPPSAATSAQRGPDCFRHPGREAGRRCTRCARPACEQCLVTATVGSQCVECARATRPAVSMRAKSWNARQRALVTMTLMAVNVAVFVLMAAADPDALGGGTISDLHIDLGLIDIGFDGRSVRGTAAGEWYRLVTSGFVHFGFIHLGFNMFLLYQLGNLIEPALGRVRFGLIYGASLLGGSAGVLLLSPDSLTAGASGAVFGLLGAAAVALHQRGVNPFSTGIGTTILLNVIITFTLPGISIGGHLGGLVAGAVAGWFASAPNWRRFPPVVTYGAPVVVAVVALAVSYAVGR